MSTDSGDMSMNVAWYRCMSESRGGTARNLSAEHDRDPFYEGTVMHVGRSASRRLSVSDQGQEVSIPKALNTASAGSA